VTAIGKKAFRSSTITSISLPEGLLSIGKEAICKTNITEITVPNSVTTLEQYAIGQNSKLKTIYIGESGGGSTWGEWVFWRSSGGYDVYMVCDIMPTLPDEYTFDDSHASKIYVKPELVDQFKADQWWGQHTILPFGTEYIDFTVDGIKYTQTAEDEVSLTYATDGKPGSSNPNTYSGDFVVPAQVTYEGKTYKVLTTMPSAKLPLPPSHYQKDLSPSARKQSMILRLPKSLCLIPSPQQGNTLLLTTKASPQSPAARVATRRSGAVGCSGEHPQPTMYI
jgi:hypothetical protein